MYKFIMLLAVIFASSIINAADTDDFIIRIQTNFLGVTGADQFKIPTLASLTYNYDVDCNNDTIDEAVGVTGDYTCDYSSLGGVGTYTIRIKSTGGTGFPRIYFNDGGDKNKILSVEQWGKNKWVSMNSAFEGAIHLSTTASDSPDFSNATSLAEMFKDATSVNPNTTNWNTSTITSFTGMFQGATSANPNVSGWNTALVQRFKYMFDGASSANPNTSNWITNEVLEMQDMFRDATSANPDTSNWNTAAVNNMANMFRGATSASPSTGNWNTSEVTTMQDMFNNATSANPNTLNWDTSKVVNMGGMFLNATSANLMINGLDTQKVTNMRFMFSGAINSNPDTGGWDISLVTDMTNMFEDVTLDTHNYDAMLVGFNAQSVQNGVTFSGGNTKYCATAAHDNLTSAMGHNWNITDGGENNICPGPHNDFIMRVVTDNPGDSNDTSFRISTNVNNFNIYNYNVDCNDDGTNEATNVTGNYVCDYSSMGGAETYTIRIKDNTGTNTGFPAFETVTFLVPHRDQAKIISIEQWGTNKWRSMSGAFSYTVNMTINATDSPDFSETISMTNMFLGATIANPNTTDWDTSNVEHMSNMFRDTSMANPDTSQWNTSKVKTMNNMFYDAIVAMPATGNWDTANVESMQSMFEGATMANPDTSLWNTSKVKEMSFMFKNAISANPNVSNWDISQVGVFDSIIDPESQYEGFTEMFSGVTLPIITYENLLINFASQSVVSNLELDGGNSNYCSAASVSARADLFLNDQWTISDGGTGNSFCLNPTSDDFVFTVKTDNAGSSLDNEFTIPALTGFPLNYNYNISCTDDGFFDVTNVSGSFTCDYLTPGIYTIRIQDASGNNTGFPRIYFNNTGDKLKIIDIRQWGTGKWSSMFHAFWGTQNLNISAQDIPDFSDLISLNGMFRGALRANPQTTNWDTSTVTTMKRMFAGAQEANPDTSNWDTGMVDDMQFMFYQAFNAIPDTSGWDIGGVTTMGDMFFGVVLPIADYDNMLIGFEAQSIQPNVIFGGGNSNYCDANPAVASLISNSNWTIDDAGQDCLPPTPLNPPDQDDNDINTHFPKVGFECSEIGNTVKIYATTMTPPIIYNNDVIATITCISTNFHTYTLTEFVDEGRHVIDYTESKYGEESGHSPQYQSLIVDTTLLDPTSIVTSPNPASNGLLVQTIIGGIELGSTVSVQGMTCFPNPVLADGFAVCNGTVGSNGLDGTNNTITIVDGAQNINTNTEIDLIIDNIAPDAPVINIILNTDLIITGTAEPESTLYSINYDCENDPVVADINGDWICEIATPLAIGTVVDFAVYDPALNLSEYTEITVTSASEEIFSDGFETIVVTFKSTDTSIIYDFSGVSKVSLNENPTLIAQGLDKNHKPIIEIHIRKYEGDLHIRRSYLNMEEIENFDDEIWGHGDWQLLENLKYTNLHW